MRLRVPVIVLAVILAVVAGVGVAMWRGAGPLPDPEACSATLGSQQVNLSTEQAQNATLIAAIGVRRGLPARAVSIALATAYQESKLVNIGYGDRDSLGLFQQRPSQGWGTAAQVRDPYYSINAFFNALEKIPDYKSLRITEAAQQVQRSGFPEAYQEHAADARALASVLTGYSPGGLFSCVVNQPTSPGSETRVVRQVDRAYGSLRTSSVGSRQDVELMVPRGLAGRRVGWSVSQFIVAHGVGLRPARVAYAGKVWKSGRGSEQGWVTGGGADTRSVLVSMR